MEHIGETSADCHMEKDSISVTMRLGVKRQMTQMCAFSSSCFITPTVVQNCFKGTVHLNILSSSNPTVIPTV